jgi:hypothetical protein
MLSPGSRAGGGAKVAILLRRGRQDVAERNFLHDWVTTERVSFRLGVIDPALAGLEFHNSLATGSGAICMLLHQARSLPC